MITTNSIKNSPKALYDRALEKIKVSSELGIAMAIEACDLAVQNGETKFAVEIDLQLANMLRKRGKNFECIERLNHGYRLINTNHPGDIHLLAEVYREYGSVYIDGFLDYATGLEYFYKCLSLDNPLTNRRLYPSIAFAYICTKQFDKAAKFLALGEKVNTEKKDYLLLAFVYENKAEMYVQMGQIPMAIDIYKLGIATANKGIEIGNPFDYVFIKSFMLTELSRCFLKLGNPEQMHPILEKIIPITEKYGLHQVRTLAALIKAEYYLLKKEYNQFKKLFQIEVDSCIRHAFHTELTQWYEMMIELSETLGEYKVGLKYCKLQIENKREYDKKTNAVNITKVLENKEKEILSLQERNREIESQKKEIEQFAYIVAHDLKTPLSNISNFGGLFLKNFKEKLDKDNKEYLDLVIGSARQMHNMLDELLRYTSLEKISGKLFPVSIEKVIESIKHNFLFEKNGIDWPEIIFENLPQVHIHPKHAYLILDRMIRNSIKFCKKDAPVKIKIEIRETKKTYEFTISDNGIGIEPVYRNKVFDLFHRLDKVDYAGTGMGLALSKKIVNNYKGKIFIMDSDLGGVSFRFDIPKRK